MRIDVPAIRATLGLFLDRLDQVHPARLALVVPLLLVVVGAAVVAVTAILATAFVVSSAIGVMILARRGIHAAATYSTTGVAP